MDAGRFDLLSRSLADRSRRGTLRAIGVLGAVGLVDRLGLTVVEARKKAGRKKDGKKKGGKKNGKKRCPTVDTCPHGRCCVCNDPTIGCKTFPRSAVTTGCDTLCGPLGSTSDSARASNSNEMAACTSAGTCVVVRCS